MRIAIAIVEAIILAMGVWVYLARADVLKAKNFSERTKALLGCRKLIKIYAAVALCALVFLAIWQEYVYAYNPFVINLKHVALVGLLFPLAYEDFFIRRISNKVILAGLIIRAVFFILEAVFCTEMFFNILKQSLLGFLVGVAFLIIGTVIIRQGIGMGDVKMIMMMGLFQGLYPVLISLMFSLVVSFFTAVVLLIRKAKGRKDTLPFAPNVLVGTFVSIALSTPRFM